MLNLIRNYLKKAREELNADPGAQPDSKTKTGISQPVPWIGVSLDGTLALAQGRQYPRKIGPAVPAMVQEVRKMLAADIKVKLFTPRVCDPTQIPAIETWLKDHGLEGLEITNIKDYYMLKLYDDRCVQVKANTGHLIGDHPIS